MVKIDHFRKKDKALYGLFLLCYCLSSIDFLAAAGNNLKFAKRLGYDSVDAREINEEDKDLYGPVGGESLKGGRRKGFSRSISAHRDQQLSDEEMLRRLRLVGIRKGDKMDRVVAGQQIGDIFKEEIVLPVAIVNEVVKKQGRLKGPFAQQKINKLQHEGQNSQGLLLYRYLEYFKEETLIPKETEVGKDVKQEGEALLKAVYDAFIRVLEAQVKTYEEAESPRDAKVLGELQALFGEENWDRVANQRTSSDLDEEEQLTEDEQEVESASSDALWKAALLANLRGLQQSNNYPSILLWGSLTLLLVLGLITTVRFSTTK